MTRDTAALRSVALRSAAVLAGMCLSLATTRARAMPPGADGVALRDATTALAELRVEDAAQTVDRLASAYPDDVDVAFERAMVRFYQGNYAGAVSDLDRAGDAGRLRSEEDRASLASLIRATHAATTHFVTSRSSDGRYQVRHAPGPDAVLVPYAIEAMRAADRTIGRDLGVSLPGPIRVEIYPTAASLAQVSSLTVEEIGRTGTIALCKWDRLMVTSPRALVRGYPWMDTVGHELVHMFLSRASRDHAPVWLQEGVAKFLERRWRGDPPTARLDPAAEGLLSAAVARDGLLPFERLHPSIARLDSQEEAALAFAQVATFVELFHQEHGGDGLRAAIRRVAEGQDAREALAEVAGIPFSALESRWQDSLRARPTPDASPSLLPLRLRPTDGQVDETGEVTEGRARRHMRLGDLLWDRRRPAAAASQYGRAHALAPDDPIVASRYARAALEGGRPQEAVDALAAFRERFPDHAPTWAVSGSAWVAIGNLEQARTALREAIRINPFDPQPHCDLAGATDDDDEAETERNACRALGGPGR
ncbi:MAG: tetratricopeptide repeat protein [Sandaracinaceae bacterium]